MSTTWAPAPTISSVQGVAHVVCAGGGWAPLAGALAGADGARTVEFCAPQAASPRRTAKANGVAQQKKTGGSGAGGKRFGIVITRRTPRSSTPA
jgi:hypothetical protein